MTATRCRAVPLITSMDDRYRRARAAVVILASLALLFGGFTWLALDAAFPDAPDVPTSAAPGDMLTLPPCVVHYGDAGDDAGAAGIVSK